MEVKQLPTGWKEVEMGNILEDKKFAVVDGPFGTQLHASEYVSEGIPVIRIKNITKDHKFNGSDLVYITESKFSEIIRSAVYPEDIILAKTGATIGKVCLLPKSIKKGLIASSCAKISVDKNDMDPEFLKIYLSTERGQGQILAFAGGSTRSSINLTPLKKIKISLPPLSTQKKIVEVLERAEGLKRRREEADGLMDDYLKSVFNEMFLGKELGEVELGKIIECLDSQRIPITESDRKKGGIPYYGANGQQDSVADFIFNERLLLLAEDGGSWGYKQKCSYIINGKSWVNNHAHALRVKKELVNIQFLMYWFNLTDLNRYISGTTRGKLNQGVMKKIKIPLPPIALQKKFASIVERVERIKEAQGKSGKEIGDLFGVLMQKAFRGEIL
ncbi:MAG: restriction endonuclease subunit S [archaeon]